MYISEREKLNQFIQLRSKYIDMLENRLITKSEFNHKNNEIFNKINLRPFSVLDSFDKALYNYNYYNSKAKIFLEEENRFNFQLNKKKARIAQNNKLNCYYNKDQSIFAMINLEDPNYIEAYYINMHSKNLNYEIYEIYFVNKEKVILHSKNLEIKKLLVTKGIFYENIKDSLIDSYINN